MTKCKACGGHVPLLQTNCGSCGARVRRHDLTPIFLILVIIAIIAAVTFESSKKEERRRVWASPKQTSGGVAKADNSGASSRNSLKWNYRQFEDQIGRGTEHYAYVLSTNQIEFGFPHDGKQRAMLVLTRIEKGQTDIHLTLDKAHFLCRSNGCRITVRFGEGVPSTYYAVPPKDLSNNTLLITGADRFMASLRAASRVSIETTFYQEGTKVFHFDTSGLIWE